MVKLISRALAALTLIIVSGVLGTPTAHASATYPISFTGIGIYPRSAPDMSSSTVGDALADGTPVNIACEATGTYVTNTLGQTLDLWDQLDSGRWIPNAFIDTGTSGRTPGVPDCGEATTGDSVINGVDLGQPQNDKHQWGACTVQDFNGGPLGWVMVDYTHGTNIVRNGMLNGWVANGGGPGIGCALDQESTLGAGSKQDFDSETLYWGPGMDQARTYAYNRQNGAQWAMANVQTPPRYDEDCTWFVSQALWAGGLQPTDDWRPIDGMYSDTPNATVAGRLVQYLETNRLAATRQEITRYKGQSIIPGAQTGDVIAYDWGDGNGINHLSMVTIASQYGTQVTAHTNPRLNAPWDLDTSRYPQVRMYLIHIYSPYSV